MRIAIVTPHRYPTPREVRVNKLASTLTALGHECIIFCPGKSNDLKLEKFKYGQICRRVLKRKKEIFNTAWTVVPCNPKWSSWLFKKFEKYSIDIVIARDLRLTLPAIYAAHRKRIRVILDISEHYPGMIKIVKKNGLITKLIRNPTLIAWLEKISVRKADMIWVVCQENAERLYKFNSSVEVIGNYPMLSEIENVQQCKHRSYQEVGEAVKIVSFGLINEIRGLDLAIKAFKLLNLRFPNTQLLIFGDGPMRKELENLAHNLGLTPDKVVFKGFVPFQYRYNAMSEGDLGIILHKSCELTQHTLPNKLFDYMGVGLPVLSTPLRPIERIIKLERCGTVVNESPEAISEGLMNLISDAVRRRIMGENGRSAIYQRYLWDHEANKIERSIANLV